MAKPRWPSRLGRLVFLAPGLFAAALSLASLFSPSTVRAEIPRKHPAAGDTLQAVLDRIHEHAANDAWKQPGWKDDAIEAWLDKLVGAVAKGAEISDLKLPVRFSDVKPGERGVARLGGGVLIVGTNVDLGIESLRNSIVLADGDIGLGGVDGCVIISRGKVTIRSMSQRSVIVAGTVVQLTFDGRFGNNNDIGSLVVSRGWVDMGRSSNGTIVAAHEGIRGDRLQGATIINAKVPGPGGVAGFRGSSPSRSVTIDDLPLERLRFHPLGEKLMLLGILHGKLEHPRGPGAAPLPGQDLFGPTGIVFRFEGRKYIAEAGKTIEDEAGQPVEALRPWKFSHASGSMAILGGSDADIVLRMREN